MEIVMREHWNELFGFVMGVKDKYIKITRGDSYDLQEWLRVIDNQVLTDLFNVHIHVNQSGELAIFKYDMFFARKDLVEGPMKDIFREARSMVIDLKNEVIVTAPFKKFFNMDEIDEVSYETILDKVKNAARVDILDKLDGSMVVARLYNKNLILHTSHSLDVNTSWRLAIAHELFTDGHKRLLRDFPKHTFIFEMIHPKDAHIVCYDNDEVLFLTGIRDNGNGKELDYDVLRILAWEYGIQCVLRENKTFDEILELLPSFSGDEKEGWVISIMDEDGSTLKIKLKTDDYVQIHQFYMPAEGAYNAILQAIADDRLDDLVAKIPKASRSHMETIAEDINKWVKINREMVEHLYAEGMRKSNGDKKAFMVWVNENVEGRVAGWVRARYNDGVDGYNVLKTKTRYLKYSEIFGNIC